MLDFSLSAKRQGKMAEGNCGAKDIRERDPREQGAWIFKF
jgi:hypothetical protein